MQVLRDWSRGSEVLTFVLVRFCFVYKFCFQRFFVVGVVFNGFLLVLFSMVFCWCCFQWFFVVGVVFNGFLLWFCDSFFVCCLFLNSFDHFYYYYYYYLENNKK